MPTISMFFGIIIKMNWKDNAQHKLAHVHAYYGEHSASFSFEGDLLTGKMPSKQVSYIKAWILLHQEELEADWQLAAAGEQTFRIDPLR